MDLLQLTVLSLASLVAGFIDAIAGGGGVVIFPAFLYLGLPVAEIVGTSKLVSTAGTTVAATTFLKKGKVTIEVLKVAAPCTLAGALLGAISVLLLPNDFLKPLVSMLIIGVALYCFFRPQLGAENGFLALNKRSRMITRLAAFGLGFYDGFFGPGTGIFLTFYFVKQLKFDFVRAAGNTKALNLLSNAIPLLYFLTQGNIRFELGIPMAVANIVGGYIGAHAAILRGSAFIKWIYIIMAALTAARLLF